MVCVHFQIWKVWLHKMKNSNKIGKNEEKIEDGW
jgi:hypothetical protein